MKRINVVHEAELLTEIDDFLDAVFSERYCDTLKEIRKIYNLGYNHGKKDLAVLVCANQPIFAKYSLSPEDLKDLKPGSLIRVDRV